jgi:hypothetical protein
MFRLAFTLCAILLLWFQSLFTTTVHSVDGTHHVFSYGWIAWVFGASFIVMLLVFAWIAWRVMNDRVIMWITLAGIPLICLAVLPQTLYERLEITETHLIHRREPPHTEYNCDIPLADIAAATKIKRETGSFSTYYAVGYELTTADGKQHVLPSCTVVSDAHESIDALLESRRVPVQTTVVRRPPPQ